MPELLNCPRCNKIFVKAFREVCNNCHQQEEDDFQKVYQFVRKKDNRRATIHEVEEATEVEKEYIYKFVKQGRISLHSFPNLAYPCESCGTMIREGRICIDCRGNITGGLERLEIERSLADRNKREENSKITTYHSVKNKIDRNR